MKEIPENRKSGPTEILSLYVLYDHPSDYPNDYIARRQIVVANGRIMIEPIPAMRGPNLEMIRALLQSKGLTNIGRMEGDDPVILEVWI